MRSVRLQELREEAVAACFCFAIDLPVATSKKVVSVT